MKRIVTPSLIERLNVNLYVSTIRLRLWHGGWPGWRPIRRYDGFFFGTMDGGTKEQTPEEECGCAGGAGVSERINGSHYMVLTVWPGHGVMDVLWQVMVLCSLCLSKQSWWTQMCSLVNNSSRLQLVQQPPAEPGDGACWHDWALVVKVTLM